MKLRNTKKGFTIVELVIVIAVIGILTAILVPVFINLTNRANEASDQSLVKNLNTALKMVENDPSAEDEDTHQKLSGKNNTMQDVVLDLKYEGYYLENLVAKSGQDLLWDASKNEFFLSTESTEANVNYWKIVNEVPTTANQKYSYYAGKNFNTTVPDLKYGFDAGYNDGVSSLKYVGPGVNPGQEVVIRTNGGSLVVNAASDSVHHYGDADSVNIIAVKSSSYHENGTVPFIQISQGRIEIEPTGDVNGIHVANIQVVDGEGNITKNTNQFSQNVSLDLNGNEVKLTRDTIGTDIASAVLVCEVKEESSSSSEFIWLVGDGTIENAKVYVTASNATPDTSVASTTNTSNASEAAIAIANNAINTGTEQAPVYTAQEAGTSANAAKESSTFKGYGTLAQPYQIGNVNELVMLSKKVSAGDNFENQYFIMTSDIDMKDVLWGVATENETINCIGTSTTPFKGNFDGQGHTVKNLTNGDRMTSDTYTNPTSRTVGNIFGLFGYVAGGTQENPLVFKNLNVTIDADIPDGKSCAALIAALKASGHISLENITVYGNLFARNEKAAGFIGSTNAHGSSVTMTKCVNEVNVKGTQRISGFISQTGSDGGADVIRFINCQNKGKICLTKVDDDYQTGKYGVAAGFISHSNGADIEYDNLCSNSGTIEAPLAANFHTYVSSAITYNGNETWKNANTDPTKMYTNISLKHTLGMVGVYETETSKAYFKLIESAWKIYNGFDGVFYHSDSAYSVFFYGDNRFESPDYCDIAAKYTADEWNAKIDATDSNIEHDSSSTMTIVLQRDLNWTANYQVGTSRTVIIDLNGHTLTATASIIHGAGAGTKITFKNGTINAEGISLVGDYYAEVNFVNVTGSYIDQ